MKDYFEEEDTYESNSRNLNREKRGKRNNRQRDKQRINEALLEGDFTDFELEETDES